MKTALSLADILARPDVWCADRLAPSPLPTLASGFAPLDGELPGGGWPRATLAEILVDGSGLGECSLVLPALGRLRSEGRWSLLIAPPHRVNGPAWAAHGVDLTRLAVVAPARPRDALWAAEQALASGALGSLLLWAPCVDAAQVRRLQVAAAGSNTVAFLFRPARAQSESSAAGLRLLLSAAARGSLAVNLLKRRGPPCTRTLIIEPQRPLCENDKSHEFHDSGPAVAGFASAVSGARSQRTLAFA